MTFSELADKLTVDNTQPEQKHMPDILNGTVLLETIYNEDGSKIHGWVTMPVEHFKKKYTRTKKMLGRYKNDPYMKKWKEKGYI